MVRNIVQEVVFKNTSPQDLYDLYMNADKHSLIAGGPVTITEKEGDPFSAHQGYITGKNLQLVKGNLIVQAWRAQSWNVEDTDSTFILYLEQTGKDAILRMTHANVPEEHAVSVEQGWYGHYWDPWKQYLAGEEITRPQM